jgi:hypothetical protein
MRSPTCLESEMLTGCALSTSQVQLDKAHKGRWGHIGQSPTSPPQYWDPVLKPPSELKYRRQSRGDLKMLTLWENAK